MSKSSRLNLYDSTNFSQLFEIKNELNKVSYISQGETEINASAIKFVKKDSDGNVVGSVVDVVSFINNLELKLNNMSLKIDSVFPNSAPPPVIPNLTTPHNLTSNNSDPNFVVSVSSVANGSTYAYMMFDGFPANSWFSPHGLFQQTGPYNTVANSVNTFQGQNGPWVKIALNEPKKFNNFRYWGTDQVWRVNRCRIWGSNDDVSYTVFFDNTNTGDLFYSPGFTNTWEPYVPLQSQQTWKYIVFQITGTGSHIGAWDTYVSIQELDFAQI
jgi:hypothetical protein